MRVTIKQVAEAAGVSRGTVDKVLHNRSGVSDEVRQRVQKIADQLGYSPNRAARALLSSRKETTFVVLIPPLTNPFFESVKKGMDKFGENLIEYGAKLEYYSFDGQDVSAAKNLLSYLASKDIQGVIARGVSSPEVNQAFQIFNQQEIPVVTYDSDISAISRLCFVGENHQKSGRVAASLLSKSIPADGKVAILLGSHKILSHQLRVKGFSQYLQEKYPEMRLVGEYETKEQSPLVFETTQKILQDCPDLAGLFNVAGGTNEIAEALITEKKQHAIKLVTYNFTAEVVRHIKNGTVDYSIGLSPFNQGYLAVEALFNYIFYNKAPESEILNVQTSIGLDENIDSLIRQEDLI